MAKQSWEMLADGWRDYDAALGRKAISKSEFARQLGVDSKTFRDWLLRPTRSKDAIPIKYVPIVGKALQMGQEAIDAVIGARIRERADDENAPGNEYAIIKGYMGRARRAAIMRAIGSADARYVLGIFRRAKSLHDGALSRDLEEAVTLFEAFEAAILRSGQLDEVERLADIQREEARTDADRQAETNKRQRVLDMLREQSTRKRAQPSPALRDRQEAKKQVAGVRRSRHKIAKESGEPG